MFTKRSSDGYIEKLDGVFQKTITYGEKSLMVNVNFKENATIPIHQHPHEQTGFVLSGKLDFQINGEHLIAETGDCWSIPGNIPHGARAIVATSVIEVFHPIREDYLPEK